VSGGGISMVLIDPGEEIARLKRQVDDLERRLKEAINEGEHAAEEALSFATSHANLQAKLAEIGQAAARHHWTEIAAMPTVYDGDRCHESIVRAFHVAEEVRRLLELGTPPAVVLKVMDLLEQRAPKAGGGS
jgi:hypothetical protein